MTIYSSHRRLIAPVLAALALASSRGILAAPQMPFTLVAATPKTLTPAMLAAAQKTETVGTVLADKKTLTFCKKAVRLVAITGPDQDMLSYRISGLRNPSLIVPREATITLLFVNTDDDMFHNIRFGAAPKTYPNVMTAYLKSSVGTPELPHKSETALYGEELIICTPAAAGRYVYLCTVRGHAEGGMAGTISVR